jgi:adenylate kinase family enzyme
MAGRLAARLGARHIELDALHWDPNWTEAPWDVFRERLAPALATDRWVVDGNYSRVRDLTWGRADTLVWLDYPLLLTLVRLTRRTIRRVVRRELLWNGNRERLWVQFTRDSLFVWALTTHARRRREILASLADPAFTHLTTVRLRSPRQAAKWLSAVAPALAAAPAPMARAESAPPPPH